MRLSFGPGASPSPASSVSLLRLLLFPCRFCLHNIRAPQPFLALSGEDLGGSWHRPCQSPQHILQRGTGTKETDLLLANSNYLS